jgi:hypothetical protein
LLDHNLEDYSIPNREESNWASSLGLIPTIEYWESTPTIELVLEGGILYGSILINHFMKIFQILKVKLLKISHLRTWKDLGPDTKSDPYTISHEEVNYFQ